MNETKIKTCTCTHKFQDKIYGKNKRVHNLMTKDYSYKCTVCQSIKK